MKHNFLILLSPKYGTILWLQYALLLKITHVENLSDNAFSEIWYNFMVAVCSATVSNSCSITF